MEAQQKAILRELGNRLERAKKAVYSREQEIRVEMERQLRTDTVLVEARERLKFTSETVYSLFKDIVPKSSILRTWLRGGNVLFVTTKEVDRGFAVEGNVFRINDKGNVSRTSQVLSLTHSDWIFVEDADLEVADKRLRNAVKRAVVAIRMEVL